MGGNRAISLTMEGVTALNHGVFAWPHYNRFALTYLLDRPLDFDSLAFTYEFVRFQTHDT